MKREIALLLLFVGVGEGAAVSNETYYIQLIKATNTTNPPSSAAKVIGSNLGKRLSHVFRWKCYWEIRRVELTLDNGKANKVQLTRKRAVALAPMPDGKIQIRLFRGKAIVRKSCHRVHDRMMAIFGGDEGKGAWFVVVRREEPRYDIARH